MHLYLVRHGQSALNARRVHQVSTTGLSELGLRQAALVARRLAGLPLDLLMSSPYERTRRTASIIGEAVGLPVEMTPLLVEVRRPSVVQGRSYDDPAIVLIKDLLHQNADRLDWRHSDEETPAEAAERAGACLHLWDARRREGATAVAAVTHGRFLSVLIARMLYGEAVHPRDLVRLESFLRMANTGITQCELDDAGRWTLVSWNDHAHLGR